MYITTLRISVLCLPTCIYLPNYLPTYLGSRNSYRHFLPCIAPLRRRIFSRPVRPRRPHKNPFLAKT